MNQVVWQFETKTVLLLFVFFVSVPIAQHGEEYIAIHRDTSFTVKSAFKKEQVKYPFIKIVDPILPDGVIARENLVYIAYDNRRLHLDLFYPQNLTDAPYPAVILVHGGGWRSGDKSHQIPMAQQLATSGYVTAAVEYRLSPEAKYPAAVQDLKAAVRWMRTNASNYPINPDKIAILGCSSGGQLAALVGTTNGVQKLDGNWLWQKDNSNDARSSSDVQAIINIDGILDFTSEEARKYEDDPTKNPSSAGAWFGGRYHEKPNLWREASPLYHVNEKTPPILFINSSIPRFHVGRDEMIKKLKRFDIYYEVHPIADSPHPFWFFHPWFEQTIALVTDFLDRVFKE